MSTLNKVDFQLSKNCKNSLNFLFLQFYLLNFITEQILSLGELILIFQSSINISTTHQIINLVESICT